jgi:hypothetical protein
MRRGGAFLHTTGFLTECVASYAPSTALTPNLP